MRLARLAALRPQWAAPRVVPLRLARLAGLRPRRAPLLVVPLRLARLAGLRPRRVPLLVVPLWLARLAGLRPRRAAPLAVPLRQRLELRAARLPSAVVNTSRAVGHFAVQKQTAVVCGLSTIGTDIHVSALAEVSNLFLVNLKSGLLQNRKRGRSSTSPWARAGCARTAARPWSSHACSGARGDLVPHPQLHR
jgi:hypothetical protein